MIYSSWELECDRLIALLTPLLKTRKIRILKKWKNCWRYHFTHVYQKPQSYEVLFLRWGRQIFVLLCHFCTFTPPPQLLTQKIIILKKWKNYMKMSSFYICVPKITIICLLRYGCNTRFLAVWVFFCPFTPLLTPKIKNWKKKKKNKETFSFSHVHNK